MREKLLAPDSGRLLREEPEQFLDLGFGILQDPRLTLNTTATVHSLFGVKHVVPTDCDLPPSLSRIFHSLVSLFFVTSSPRR